MEWFRADINFGFPFVRFVLGHRDAAILNALFKQWKLSADDPAALERLFVDLIATHRPELAEGGKVLWIGSRGGLRLEICYYHPSLPAVPTNGEAAPAIDLMTGDPVENW